MAKKIWHHDSIPERVHSLLLFQIFTGSFAYEQWDDECKWSMKGKNQNQKAARRFEDQIESERQDMTYVEH